MGLRVRWSSSLDWPAYLEAFNAVQDYIRAGDCYQINLTRQFNARYQGSPLGAYRQLRNTAAAPFSAYWDFGAGQLLSIHGERLEIRIDVLPPTGNCVGS